MIEENTAMEKIPCSTRENNEPEPSPKDENLELLKEQIYDIISTIRDPEKPYTLEELDVVQADLISVSQPNPSVTLATITWVPTVPHCHLALTIALCIRVKLQRELAADHLKIDIIVQDGKHSQKAEIDRQVNDKERYSAAMEKEEIMAVIEDLIQERY
uniref:MIP18 family-like domain-containing protein n=1 Tax=Euplotes harpa TaxID=151035 RepID=A0A7S3NGP8_9SPIT